MGYLVRRTYRNFTGALEERLSKHGVSISMWFFLRLLWEEDGRNQRELSEELGLTPPTTVSAMDNLERRGLIRRERGHKDRRQVSILLTASGRKLRTKLAHYATEVNAIALKELNAAEVSELRRLLMKVDSSLAESRAVRKR